MILSAGTRRLSTSAARPWSPVRTLTLLLDRPQLGDRALDDHAAFDEYGGSVTDEFHLMQEVRGEEHGGALPAKVANELAHVLHALRIEPAGGLVQDDQVWAVDEGQRDAEPLPHAMGVTTHL